MVQDFIFVKKNKRFEKICFSEIIYVRGMRGYAQLVTEAQTYFVLNTMDEIQKHLPKNLFCRVHRSYIVCLARIRAFDNTKICLCSSSAGGKSSEVPGKNELPVGRAYRNELRRSVKIIPNKTNKYVNKILNNAQFLHELELDED